MDSLRDIIERVNGISSVFQQAKSLTSDGSGFLPVILFTAPKPVEQPYMRISAGVLTASGTFNYTIYLRFWRNQQKMSEIIWRDTNGSLGTEGAFSTNNFATAQPPNPNWDTFKINASVTRWVPSFNYNEICDRVTLENEPNSAYGATQACSAWLRVWASELPF